MILKNLFSTIVEIYIVCVALPFYLTGLFMDAKNDIPLILFFREQNKNNSHVAFFVLAANHLEI